MIVIELTKIEEILHTTITYSQFPLLEIFLQTGIDPNVRHPLSKSTPLHLSTWLRNETAIRILIKYGADTETKVDREDPVQEEGISEEEGLNKFPGNLWYTGVGYTPLDYALMKLEQQTSNTQRIELNDHKKTFRKDPKCFENDDVIRCLIELGSGRTAYAGLCFVLLQKRIHNNRWVPIIQKLLTLNHHFAFFCALITMIDFKEAESQAKRERMKGSGIKKPTQSSHQTSKQLFGYNSFSEILSIDFIYKFSPSLNTNFLHKPTWFEILSIKENINRLIFTFDTTLAPKSRKKIFSLIDINISSNLPIVRVSFREHIIPSLHLAFDSFVRMTIGHGVGSCDLLRASSNLPSDSPKEVFITSSTESTDTYSESYPVIVSRWVEGDTLEKVLSLNDQSILSNLDSEYLSDLILIHMLLLPQGSSGQNYIVEPFEKTIPPSDPLDNQTPLTEKKYRLVCLDLSHFWPFERKETKDSNNATEVLTDLSQAQSQTILFCLPQMLETVNSKTREKFRSLKFDYHLCMWITQLMRLQRQIDNLFSANEKEAMSKNSPIDIKLTDKMIGSLFQNFHRLQVSLTTNSEITHLQLLRQIRPNTGVLYQTAFSEYNHPLERYSNLFQKNTNQHPIHSRIPVTPSQEKSFKETVNSIDIQEHHRNFKVSSDRLPLISQNSFCSELTEIDSHFVKSLYKLRKLVNVISEQRERLYAIRKDVENGNTSEFSQLLTGFKEFILNGNGYEVHPIDFSKMIKSDGTIDLERQKKILKEILNSELNTLVMSKCISLSDKKLNGLLKSSPGLLHLEISDCPKVSSKFLSLIVDSCPHLVSLSLSDLPQLTHLNLHRSKSSLGQLETLYIRRCIHLEYISSTSESLKTLLIGTCPKFSLIQSEIYKRSLISFSVTNNSLITTDEIKNFLSSTKIEFLRLIGCEKIYYRNVFELHPQLMHLSWSDWPSDLLLSHLESFITSSKSTCSLSLNGTKMKDIHVPILCSVIKEMSREEELGTPLSAPISSSSSLPTLSFPSTLDLSVGQLPKKNKVVKLTELDLSDNLISNHGVNSLYNTLLCCTSLQRLSLVNNFISSRGTAPLISLLRRHQSLVSINVRGNFIKLTTTEQNKLDSLHQEKPGRQLFITDIKANYVVRKVREMIEVGQFVSQTIEFKDIKSLTNEQIQSFCHLFQRDTPFSRLKIKKMSFIQDEYFTSLLSTTVSLNTTVHYLSLRKVSLSDPAISALLNGLITSCSIVKFKLQDSQITDHHVEDLSNLFQKNKVLSVVNISGNHLTDSSVSALTTALSKSSLTFFSFVKNSLSNKAETSLINSCKKYNISTPYSFLNSVICQPSSSSKKSKQPENLIGRQSLLQSENLIYISRVGSSFGPIDEKEAELESQLNVERLSLNYLLLDSKFIKDLSDFLCKTPSVKILEMKNVKIPKKCISELIACLSRVLTSSSSECKLDSLNLSQVNFTNKDLIELFQILSHENITLTKLDLRHHENKIFSLDQLKTIIKTNQSLSDVLISSNAPCVTYYQPMVWGLSSGYLLNQFYAQLPSSKPLATLFTCRKQSKLTSDIKSRIVQLSDRRVRVTPILVSELKTNWKSIKTSIASELLSNRIGHSWIICFPPGTISPQQLREHIKEVWQGFLHDMKPHLPKEPPPNFIPIIFVCLTLPTSMTQEIWNSTDQEFCDIAKENQSEYLKYFPEELVDPEIIQSKPFICTSVEKIFQVSIQKSYEWYLQFTQWGTEMQTCKVIQYYLEKNRTRRTISHSSIFPSRSRILLSPNPSVTPITKKYDHRKTEPPIISHTPPKSNDIDEQPLSPRAQGVINKRPSRPESPLSRPGSEPQPQYYQDFKNWGASNQEAVKNLVENKGSRPSNNTLVPEQGGTKPRSSSISTEKPHSNNTQEQKQLSPEPISLAYVSPPPPKRKPPKPPVPKREPLVLGFGLSGAVAMTKELNKKI